MPVIEDAEIAMKHRGRFNGRGLSQPEITVRLFIFYLCAAVTGVALSPVINEIVLYTLNNVYLGLSFFSKRGARCHAI
jgi:hypothetical protein